MAIVPQMAVGWLAFCYYKTLN